MSNVDTQYEIKFLLDANQVLTDKHTWRTELVHLEQSEGQQIDIRFIDTPEQDFFRDNWILRARLKPNKDQWEITYKKRFNFSEGQDLQQVMDHAKELGFNLEDPTYKQEVDWSGADRTFDLSYEVKAKIVQEENLDEWRGILNENAPPMLKTQKWGERDFSAILTETRVLGPITALKYKGQWDGIQESVEIWTVAGNSIVEISTEATGLEAAESSHRTMEGLLSQQNLLPIQHKISKTRWAMDIIQHPAKRGDPFSLLLQGGFNLYFRHARPVGGNGDEDPLSELGKTQARQLGEILRNKKIPLQIPVLSSPVMRALQTAVLAFPNEGEVITDERLPSVDELQQVLEVKPELGTNQVLVAHYHTFKDQLQEFLDHLGLVILQPLGTGQGYRIIRQLDILQASLVKYGSGVIEPAASNDNH
ncbi:hypothetical protein HNR77_004713 [Paenibacillus sp. JGP012]|uniref:histidine phosphatase family protein n=1 Tax=Paenibacillus sp. JGP012 TaxID=2735914 RepID=UPI00160D980C|nr:histidine phosphatase family protein [Paenibacillus sp. JGP012]MBB6023612.1 hypothetical protein [Paenibacillus sp. JGP012]